MFSLLIYLCCPKTKMFIFSFAYSNVRYLQHTNQKTLLPKTSRVYCSKRRDQTGSFQSHHCFKRDFTHGCTRKFTIQIYIYSYSKKISQLLQHRIVSYIYKWMIFVRVDLGWRIKNKLGTSWPDTNELTWERVHLRKSKAVSELAATTTAATVAMSVAKDVIYFNNNNNNNNNNNENL